MITRRRLSAALDVMGSKKVIFVKLDIEGTISGISNFLKEGCLTRAIPCKKHIFLHSAIPPRIFGVEQKFWYLGISTARDLHAEHVFKFRKVDRVPYPRPPTEKLFLR